MRPCLYCGEPALVLCTWETVGSTNSTRAVPLCAVDAHVVAGLSSTKQFEIVDAVE